MKHRITVQQLNKLPESHKQRLHEWWKPRIGDFYSYHEIGIKTEGEHLATNDVGPWVDEEANIYAVPLLSVGQMFEFIQEKRPQLKGISKNRFDKWFVNLEMGQLGYKDELCDALWEATVQILKNTVQG